MAMKIGRRPIYLVGSLLNFVGCIVGRFQTTIEMQWATNILTGFGAAPVDSLVQITTTDIFFAHEKGTRMSLYVFTIYAGSYLGPVAAGAHRRLPGLALVLPILDHFLRCPSGHPNIHDGRIYLPQTAYLLRDIRRHSRDISSCKTKVRRCEN
ncbi:MFS transporter, putative ion transporter [Histoplasma ohiense]|nr:MFS transporter, putative ion transporter [Histoplasma ohiense (nom. inval.)]